MTQMRRRAVASVQKGEPRTSVAAAFGVNERVLYRWLAAYRQGGWSKLGARRQGGRPPKLDTKAIRWISETIATKSLCS